MSYPTYRPSEYMEQAKKKVEALTDSVPDKMFVVLDMSATNSQWLNQRGFKADAYDFKNGIERK